MKEILTLVFALTFLIPSVSSAAALTSEQARSLIQVVQSSITTPAGVFVPLITAFSSITITQAESLINVVQQSPATPASAFVDLLVSFTEDTPALAPVSQPTTPSNSSTPPTTITPIPLTTTAPVSKARIEIINPIATKGLNRPHSTSSNFDQYGNPENEIYIGAVVYGEDGEPTRTAVVEVTATDASQNKTINGTGNVTPIYVNGQKHQTPFYPFSYEIKTVGEHTITFSTNGLTTSTNFVAK